MSVEESPEFQKALNEACEKQYRGYLFGGEYKKAESKDKIGETLKEIEAERKRLMETHEGYMRQAELAKKQARFIANPHMREITETLGRKHRVEGLICPVCGERDHGNRINGKPYCFMNAKHKEVGGPVPLMTPEEAEEWKPPEKQKPQSFTFKEPEGIMRTRGVRKKRPR